jgi:hypothetical protein
VGTTAWLNLVGWLRVDNQYPTARRDSRSFVIKHFSIETQR